jgi:hypothetical protein
MNSFWFFVILFVMIMLFVYFINRSVTRKTQQRIMDDLASRGATDITVKWNWGGSGRGNYTFDVEYADRSGNRQLTRCKATASLFIDPEIYWRDPPEI